jgi:Tol biopolymer transport system component
VAFTSAADDLGPADTNAARDVYLRDLSSGTTTLVSVNATGRDSGNGGSYAAELSPDGTKIAFDSQANDLGPIDTLDGPGGIFGGSTDIYVRDLVHQSTTLVSANADGTDSGNSDSFLPVFSPDGQHIVFRSEASNLGPTDHDRPGYLIVNVDVYVATFQGADLSIEEAT